ncbi:MAG: amidohydrolase/deacetylase family metallohydrolase [Planctomycetota bacterium]|nr:amidohydrolase/deacetylase family metallohydrolase [Planctomycetota bacterium]MDA1138172.1 amidohydrolase/deacetylase family metallohydrolase [Planctomycetota bacterium]
MDPEFELLLRGGHVIDPKNHLNGLADIAIRSGKVAEVSEFIGASRAAKVVDVSGLYVVPGLIDMHVHVYGGYEGWLFPDQHALPNGVTTVVDTGGAGWKDFEDFIETIIAKSITRVLAFINIVGAGMTGRPEQDTNEMEARPCAEMIRRYPKHAVGSKSAHFQGPGWESAGGAIEAARLSDSIAMIDFAPKPSRSYQELLERLNPGDIHTHLYAGHIPLLDENLVVNEYVRDARGRGVVFDTGHGNMSFLFRNAIPAIGQGFPPDTISTDLHKSSRMVDTTMPVTMSKFLVIGMPLEEVIDRSTRIPAEVLRRPELGHLSVGAEADIAVLERMEGNFGFVDSLRTRLEGNQKLECQMTLRAGKIVWDRNGISFPKWSDV